MKQIIFISILFANLFPACLSGQERSKIKFGDIAVKDFDLPKSPVVDSNTNGVILYNIGSTHFIGNEKQWFSYVHKRHVRMKVINKKAFDLGTIKFYLYGEKDGKDKVKELKATVYNIENGKIVQSSVGKADVFEEKLSTHMSENKVALPSIKEGCIIEYTYTIVSDDYYYIPDWYFQNPNYPVLYSEYDVVFPNMLSFAQVRHGTAPFFIDKQTVVKNNSYIVRKSGVAADFTEVVSDDIRRVWVMKDVPVFKSERFINGENDYLERLEFFLAKFNNGDETFDRITSWDVKTKDLLESPSFGEAIHPDKLSTFSNVVAKVTQDDKNLTESARHLFSYVRDNFTCIPNNYIYLTNDLYEVNKKKKGSVAEINLLLTGLLRQKGIPADPVLLSTRSYGVNIPDFPSTRKMNYVLCMARLYGDTIYLDASRPDLGFGKLSQECYNGHARIISDKGASVYFSPQKMVEQQNTRVFILNDGKNKLKGAAEVALGFFATEDLRKEVGEVGENKYFDKIRLNYEARDIQLTATRIDSLHKPEFAAAIHQAFSKTVEDDIFYFNPIVTTDFTENPFKSEQRKHPVSLPYPIDDLYTLNMEIPEGYTIEELPKSVKVSYNGDEGFFEYIVQKSQSDIQLRSRIKLNKATIPAEEYDSLRDFFAFVVKKQSEQIVFKKKN